MINTLIAQGAEAKLFRKGAILIKERTPKHYRLKEIDEKLRTQRTRREARMLERSAHLIPVPRLLSADETKGTITMQFIPGKKIADCLDFFNPTKRRELCEQIGRQVALLHNNNIIHGDLTTSNMILQEKRIYFLDFGLSFIDEQAEHKAVDLHLLKQALESKHWRHYEPSYKAVIEGYLEEAQEGTKILERLRTVELRGRYKRKGS
ncbi:MAG TPA: KEOPS complex kinase/ATPase Bud32 [Candidatus Nanoarchaeia archaeon]|nr:KEOPS complex kinase/ATPase Bud32 [Candidatus Nanoarchaeia archaeon]